MGDIPNVEKNRYVIEGPTGNDLVVNSNGSVNVVSTPGTPPSVTRVSTGGVTATNVTKLGGTNTFSYTIPNGAIFYVQSFEFGGYVPANSANPVNAKCEFYYRPNGAGNVTGQVLVDVIYLNSTSFIREIYETGLYVYTGNGTRSLDMVITNWSKDDLEASRILIGYY